MDAIILVIVFLAIVIAVIVDKIGSRHRTSQFPYTLYPNQLEVNKSDITELDINEIKSCGRFTPEERAAEYRRRGKSPSGVIDGEYNDEYRGNDEYNDEYHDWDANA